MLTNVKTGRVAVVDSGAGDHRDGALLAEQEGGVDREREPCILPGLVRPQGGNGGQWNSYSSARC